MTARYASPRPLTLPAVSIVAACAMLGIAASVRPAAALVIAPAAAAMLLSLYWRGAVFVLLAALPLAGLPAMLAGTAGLAARDAFVILPLYAAFAVAVTRDREPLLPPLGVVTPALAVLAALVLLYAFAAPTPLAGAIGAKVWLAYIPMLAVGYRYVRTPADFDRALRLTVLLALVPASLGIAEWAFAVTRGDFGPFEPLYRGLGASDSQRFVAVTAGDDVVRVPRVLSTFTGVTQHFAFTLVATAAALSLALRSQRPHWWAPVALFALAAMLSGARAAYLLVPALFVITFVVARPPQSYVRAAIVACVALLLLAEYALIIGGPPAAFANALIDHVGVTLRTATSELSDSFALTGAGTGSDTNAAMRYGGVAEGRYVENWYAKAMLELGLGGMLAAVAVVAGIAWKATARASAATPSTRRAVAPFCALFIVVAVALFKGPYVDLDPLNVYYWLLAGMVFGLYRATSRQQEQEPA